jgi:CubicO group peptidase (beta-lactamase class C family)
MVTTLLPHDPHDLIAAAPEVVGLSSVKLQHLTRLVHGYVDDGKIPGAIAVVLRRGKVVHVDVVGRSDVETAKPMTWDTIFRIASMTKPITSVALMTLYEEGKFQLDDPVARFIPAFAGLKVLDGGDAATAELRAPVRAMTVRDLLTHTSGLVSGGGPSPVSALYEQAGVRSTAPNGLVHGTLADTIAKLSELPLAFDPGTRWSYGISTDVVASLCELLSGMPFGRFLAERIFMPLGMRDTGYWVPPDNLPRFAANYGRGTAEQPSYVLLDPSDATSPFAQPATYFSGLGDLVSTAADYLRFCTMLTSGGALDGARILGPRTLQLMMQNHLPDGRDVASMGQRRFIGLTMAGTGFGLGFAVLLDPTRAQLIGTPGESWWGGAFSTVFFVAPRDDLAVIFLTQLQLYGVYPFHSEVRAAVYGSLTG